MEKRSSGHSDYDGHKTLVRLGLKKLDIIPATQLLKVAFTNSLVI